MKRAPHNIAQGASGKKLKSAVVDRAGSIESVTLINFMCHEHFIHKFSPKMNFIIGQNGSGKSAILTAIILVLGGKSSVTGRFSNVRGFIKTGKQKAKIEIVLRNQGENSYKPDVYGNKIIVVREINSDGVAFYRLKASDGRIISHTKEELNNILSNMDIKVENPVAVLTQEKSRNFLLSKQPKKLYQFFYQGTGLQALEETYNEILVTKEDSLIEMEKKKQALPAKEKEIREWENYLESAKRQTDFKKELIWAGVIEGEKLLEEKEQEYAHMENEVERLTADVEKFKKVYDENCKNVDDSVKSRKESEAAVVQHTTESTALKEEYEKYASALRTLEGSLDLYRREAKKLADDMASLESNINEQRLRNQNDSREVQRQREECIQRLRNDNQRINAEREELKLIKEQKMQENADMEGKHIDLNNEKNSNQTSIDRIKAELNHANNVLKNKVNAFGEYTGQVLQAIKARRAEFRKVPIGPIGLHLEVVDPKWCAAVETCINPSMLRSFCVDNQQDSEILKDILKQYYKNIPSLIVSPFVNRVFDVKEGMAQTHHPTVLHMLRIKQPVVANCLIDQVGIENSILIEDSKTAVDLMLKKPPRNCRNVYLLNCDQICSNPYRYYSSMKKSYKPLLSFTNQSDIRNLEEALRHEIEIRDTKVNEISQVQRNLANIKSEFKKLDHKIAQLSAYEKSNLERIREELVNEETKDVDCMEEDLNHLKREHEVKVHAIETTNVEAAKLKEQKQNIKKQVEERIIVLRKEKENFEQLGVKLNKFSKHKEAFATAKTKSESELRTATNKFMAVKNEVERTREGTQKLQSDAEEVCPRINTTRSAATIQRQIAETQKVIEKQSNCNYEDLHTKYREKREQLIKAKQEYTKIENYITTIDKMIKTRGSKFSEIRLQTEHCMDLAFTCLLHGNNYTGRLQFDDEDRTLDMVVSPRREMGTRKNHSTLSGGERSFVTIAFLLALWERTQSPFRILDEYDVFMDSNNRQLSVDLLIKKAEQMTNTQFVFLSPLDLPNIKASDNVNIRRMKPPERVKENMLPNIE